MIQKGVTELRPARSVPDVYTQIMLLENENKNLKKDLKHFKQAAEYVVLRSFHFRLSKNEELNEAV